MTKQQLAVELVGTVDAVLQIAEYAAERSQRYLKPDGMRSGGQIKAVIPAAVSELAKLPVVAVLKAIWLTSENGIAPIDAETPNGALTAVVILTALKQDCTSRLREPLHSIRSTARGCSRRFRR
jgi:hypothetical protein